MAASKAQITTNRQNAQRSTGPQTPEGKDRVRRNALKHGLTGRGVALPIEDQEEISRRFSALQIQLAPSNDISEQLIRRVAFLFVRIERCEKHETSQTAKRVRHATLDYDDARMSHVENLVANFDREFVTVVRQLKTMPEGIDWLIDQWEILHIDLHKKEDRAIWGGNHWLRFEMLQGRHPGQLRVGRTKALSEATDGFFLNLDRADGEGLEGPARAEWRAAELARMMTAEVAQLKEIKARLDPSMIAIDRAEAVNRVLFDTSPEANLARKYEADTEKSLYKALKELRQVEADAALRRKSNITVDTEETYDELALNLQADGSEGGENEPELSTTPQNGVPAIIPLVDRSIEGSIPVEIDPDGPA